MEKRQTKSQPAANVTNPDHVIPLRHCTSLISFLISTGIHLLVLVILTLLVVASQHDAPLQLEFAIANVADESESFESFEVDMPVADVPPETSEASAPDSSTMAVGIAAFEPTLVDLGSLAGAAQQGDGLSLTTEVVPTSGKKSNRKGSFFGAHAYGDEFVFVVDSSASMLSPCNYRYGHTRFQVACQELLRSIKNLDDDQKFCVFFFGARTRVMFDKRPKLIAATNNNRQRLTAWIRSLSPGAGTDPRYGVIQAMKLKPSAIFLLSDGEFNGQSTNFHQIPGNPSVERIIKRYLHLSIPMHTFAFEDMLNRRRLRTIAVKTGGTHKFIGSQSEQQLLVLDLVSNNPTDVQFAMQSLIERPQELANDSLLLKASQRLTKLLSFRDPKIRESAHEAMLAVAESLELDITETEAIELNDLRDANDARQQWDDLWDDYFRSRAERTGMRLTKS